MVEGTRFSRVLMRTSVGLSFPTYKESIGLKDLAAQAA